MGSVREFIKQAQTNFNQYPTIAGLASTFTTPQGPVLEALKSQGTQGLPRFNQTAKLPGIPGVKSAGIYKDAISRAMYLLASLRK